MQKDLSKLSAFRGGNGDADDDGDVDCNVVVEQDSHNDSHDGVCEVEGPSKPSALLVNSFGTFKFIILN